jgi:uncharacterized membrane protein
MVAASLENRGARQMTEVLLYLHIILFVFSFAFTAGISILGDRVAKMHDAAAVHALFSTARPLSIAGGIGWILTALAGGALAQAYGYNMGAPWLLGSYATFAVLILTGFLLHSPWQEKVIAASASPGPELGALLHSPLHRIASALSAISILTLLYLMTARPG